MLAREPECCEHVVEQAARRADERLALRVFLGARRFADEHPCRIGCTDAGDRALARAAQAAGPALRDVIGERVECKRCDAREARITIAVARFIRVLAASRRIGVVAVTQPPQRRNPQLAQHLVACRHQTGAATLRRSQRITRASSRAPPRLSGG